MSPPYLPVALSALVTVLINGTPAPSSPPAQLAGGHVLAPPVLIAKFADRVTTFPDGGLTATRAERACVALPVMEHMVALAPLARCLGAHVAWDPQAKTITLAFPTSVDVRTPAPFDVTAPQVAPTTIFTPEPPSPTPRAIETGVPRPRRTAIPETPSLPVPSETPTTAPRR